MYKRVLRNQKNSVSTHYTDWPYTADDWMSPQDDSIEYVSKTWPWPSFFRNRQSFFKNKRYYTRSICREQIWCYDGDPELFLIILYLWDMVPGFSGSEDHDPDFVKNEYSNVTFRGKRYGGPEDYLIGTGQIPYNWRQHPCSLPKPHLVEMNWSYFHRN